MPIFTSTGPTAASVRRWLALTRETLLTTPRPVAGPGTRRRAPRTGGHRPGQTLSNRARPLVSATPVSAVWAMKVSDSSR